MARNNLQLPHVVGEDLPRVFGTLEDIPMTQKLREVRVCPAEGFQFTVVKVLCWICDLHFLSV